MKQKGIAAMLLGAAIAVFALAGCGGFARMTEEESEESTQGQYVEREIALPEVFANGTYFPKIERKGNEIFIYGVLDFRKAAEDTLPQVLYRFNEDGSFTDVTAEWMKQHEEGYRGKTIQFLPNGDAYVLYDNEQAGCKIKYYNKEEDTLEEVGLKLPGGWSEDIIILENGTILLYDGGSVYVYLEGENEYSTRYEALTPLFVYDAGKVIARPTEYGKDGYFLLDAYSGEMVSQVTPEEVYPADGRYHYHTWVDVEEQGIYVLTPRGIFFGQEGAQSWQMLIDGENTAVLGGSIKYCNGMVKGFADDFYVVLDDKLYCYAYNASKITIPDKGLRIYSLEDNRFVRKALEEFRAAHPEFTVTYETADAGVSREEAVKKLNTQISGGNGPDVLILDGLPIESYIEKGVLMELGSVMKTVMESGGYYEDIIRTYETEEGLYGAVSRFMPVFAAGSEEIMPYTDSISKLAEYSRSHIGVPIFTADYYRDTGTDKHLFLKMLYTYYGCELYTAEGNITEETLKNWLTCAQVLYDNMPSGKESDEVVRLKMYELYRILIQKEGNLTFLPEDFISFNNLVQPSYFDGYSSWYTGKYIAGTVVGIGASTLYPKEAGELAAALFSDTCQGMEVSVCRVLPVQKISCRDYLEEQREANEETWYNGELDESYPVYGMTEQELDGYLKEIETEHDAAAIEDYTVYAAEPDRVLKVLCESASDYLEGKKTLDSASNDIWNRIQLMENE